jgi:hypothetical protein
MLANLEHFRWQSVANRTGKDQMNRKIAVAKEIDPSESARRRFTRHGEEV